MKTGLGEALPGVPTGTYDGHDDYHYTGDSGESSFTLQYYRNKADEFQRTLNALDMGAQSAQNLLAVLEATSDGQVDEELRSSLWELMDQYESKKTSFRLTAEAINAGAYAINAAGGRFPQLSIPSGLGLAFVLPAAAVAAFAAIAGLTAFAISWLNGYKDLMKRQQILDNASPALKQAMAQSYAEADNAVSLASAQGLFGGSLNLANIFKYAGLGLAAYLAWKAYENHTRKG